MTIDTESQTAESAHDSISAEEVPEGAVAEKLVSEKQSQKAAQKQALGFLASRLFPPLGRAFDVCVEIIRRLFTPNRSKPVFNVLACNLRRNREVLHMQMNQSFSSFAGNVDRRRRTLLNDFEEEMEKLKTWQRERAMELHASRPQKY